MNGLVKIGIMSFAHHHAEAYITTYGRCRVLSSSA
jgi:hypothetical protein